MQEKKWTLDIESRQYFLEQGKFYLIGRLQEETNKACSDITLTSQSVDAKHCIVDVCGDILYIYDLHSVSGTFVNGKRLEALVKVSTGESELRFGDITGQLRLNANVKTGSFDSALNKSENSMDIFLKPINIAPRSSIANKSTGLFSSPDVSLSEKSTDDSFNIPETQHMKQRISMGDSKVSSKSRDNSFLKDSFTGLDDDSFIPETQMLTTANEANHQVIRICTQDFNENLLTNDEDDEDFFSSLVIPKIQHKPVILVNDMEITESDNANSASNVELRVANRTDTCTPDLFDLAELTQVNAEVVTEVPDEGPVSGGDGYAEEVHLMPTQVFTPVSRKFGLPVKEPDDRGCEESLNGKENIPQSELCLEQTQVYAPIKASKMLENNKNCVSANELPDNNTSPLPPTQIFSTKGINISQQTNKLSTTAGRILLTPDSERPNRVADFLEGINYTPKTHLESEVTKRHCDFKKPKEKKVVTKSSSKAGSAMGSPNLSSLQETEDLQLCTPKWISDNFELLSVQQNGPPIKLGALVPDSDEEVDELTRLTAARDSKDFERLLSNINDIPKPSKHMKPVHSTSLIVKRERTFEGNKGSATIQIEKTQDLVPIKNGKRTSHKSKKSEKQDSKQKFDVDITKERQNIISVMKTVEKVEGKRRNVSNKHSSAEHENNKKDVPARRMTRLRSRVNNRPDEAESISTISAPSAAKQRKVEENNKPEPNKECRVPRSRSAVESQEDTTSKKSSGSCSLSKGKKSSPVKQKRGKCDSGSERNSSEVAKPTTSKALRNARSKDGKRAMELTSDDQPKRLRSNTRILQVAMTMVEPSLFQSLIENSSGNWCVANNPVDADVLVMDKGNRTFKFLIAMAKGIPIVTSKWLESFNQSKTVPRGAKYFFKDADFERRHKFSLLRSLETARNRKIFEGYDFLTTPGILPQPDDIKQIIECSGGTVHKEPPPPKANQKIYLISTISDQMHWHKYRRCNNNIRITTSEGLMASVIRQYTAPLDLNVMA